MPEVIEDFFVGGRPRVRRSAQGDRHRQPRLPRRQGAAQPAPDRRAAGSPVRPARPGVRQDRLRQGRPPDRPDAGMGHARPPAVRGGPHRRPRPRRRSPAARRRSSTTCTATGPAVLDVFAASIKDGRGNTLHRRLFVVETSATGEMALHEPTILHDITPAPTGTPPRPGVNPPARPPGGRAVPLRAGAEAVGGRGSAVDACQKSSALRGTSRSA